MTRFHYNTQILSQKKNNNIETEVVISIIWLMHITNIHFIRKSHCDTKAKL